MSHLSTFKMTLFLLLALPIIGHSQLDVFYLPEIKVANPRTVPLKVGETNVPVKVTDFGENPKYVFINLHADEQSSLIAGRKIAANYGGRLINIENNKKRNIQFTLKGKKYTFDPNRVFARIGCEQSLNTFGKSTKAAIDEAEQFGRNLLALFPDTVEYIVALHNNTDGAFSIHSYVYKGDRTRDAKEVNVNPHLDPDDIFITTDSSLYAHLSELKYNIVLQDAEKVKRDGSLSVYSAENNLKYVNCETQHGKVQEYMTMMNDAMEHITKSTLYNEYIFFNKEVNAITEKMKIFYQGKEVGYISKVMKAENQSEGTFLLHKNLTLHSNMLFFSFTNSQKGTHIEIRELGEEYGQPEPITKEWEILSLPYHETDNQ